MKAALRSIGLAGICATLVALTAQAQYYQQQYYSPWYSYNN